MAMGKSVLKDTLIQKTTTRKAKEKVKAIPGRPSLTPGTNTYGTTKKAFYMKPDLYKRLKNFAYQDRHTITEAFNLVVEDGLKGKNTKDRG